MGNKCNRVRLAAAQISRALIEAEIILAGNGLNTFAGLFLINGLSLTNVTPLILRH
jgi:hypothetical protein